MNLKLKKKYLLLVLVLTQFTYSQEGIAVYSDYLSDNYYLIHPSMAGAANCGKVRLTGRGQWFGQAEAPSLSTLSFNTSVGERSGVGAILFSDKNGYHSQKGIKLTYAHHIMFSRSELDLNQLSFGLSGALIQSQLDETSFLDNQPFDPNIGGILQKDSYFNVDLGASYNYLEFYTHFTVKNLLNNFRRELYSEFESDNIRKYIWSAGYVFGSNEEIQWEPSVMFQLVEATKERSIDLNLKVYKELDFGRMWGGLSYRRTLDGAEFLDGTNRGEQRLQYFTPIIGVNYNQFMFAYTYSYLTGNVRFDNAGFHQITLGINLFCKREKYQCNCPAIN
ncbi:type IX secretion system membrane protein PorP/SprF [Flavobacterium sp.]|jgi:type IX secretion system PorP/SprF family membrane protein|uniref:type IX secretion system membrane protein PorP/SprF n=1 Tax=Flavobacterium sp. TaxID=239 RepID=UPI0037BF5392